MFSKLLDYEQYSRDSCHRRCTKQGTTTQREGEVGGVGNNRIRLYVITDSIVHAASSMLSVIAASNMWWKHICHLYSSCQTSWDVPIRNDGRSWYIISCGEHVGYIAILAYIDFAMWSTCGEHVHASTLAGYTDVHKMSKIHLCPPLTVLFAQQSTDEPKKMINFMRMMLQL